MTLLRVVKEFVCYARLYKIKKSHLTSVSEKKV